MKKKILSSLLVATITTTGVLANEINEPVLKSDYKNTKEMMVDLKTSFPIIHELITDYFQAKKCQENIDDIVSVDEIREFATTYQFGFLMGMKYQNTPILKANYLALIGSYKLMNCGDKDGMEKFIVGTSAISVEMNKK